MAVGSQVFGFVRRGIWASLTGGWCFEPSHSLICNTIHLYLWVFLFLIPLLIAISSPTTWIAYLISLGINLVIFVIAKTNTHSLHRMFDEQEPSIAVKPKVTTKKNVYKTPGSSFSTTRRETSNIDGQAMEMAEIEPVSESKDSDVKTGKELQNQMDMIYEEERSSSASNFSTCVDQANKALLTYPDKPQETSTLLPADSLELLPLTRFNGGRKMSEPNFGQLINKSDRAIDTSKFEQKRQIRRAKSTNDTVNEIQVTCEPDYMVGHSHLHPKKINVEDEHWVDMHDDEQDDQPCCSKYLDMPKSEEDIEHGSSQALPNTALHRTLERIAGENLPDLRTGTEGDLKVQITKFLEDLIEKHPETLDAIENVRMNRLGKSAMQVAIGLDQKDNTLPQGTHVAYDHEDTTNGAVHSFQDEQGNWWTYAFDEQGNGTAQALGSSTAVAELFGRRRVRTASHGDGRPRFRSVVNTRNLDDSLPSSSRTREGRYERHGQVRSQSLSRRNSVPESSSASFSELESFSASRKINYDDSDSDKGTLDAPSSTFHPTRRQPSTVRSRHSSRNEDVITSQVNRPFITFVNLASRLYSNQLHRNVPVNRERSSFSSGPNPPNWNLNNQQLNMSQQSRMALEAFAQESRMRLQVDNNDRFQWQDYMRLDPDVANADNLTSNSRRQSQNYPPVAQTRPRNQRQQPAPIDYYYNYNPIPKWFPCSKFFSFSLPVNRLSVISLFDHNSSFLISALDTWTALLVALVATVIITRGIFSGPYLFIFAGVVASSQFSLLKSVQPDAASPIHGFNKLVTYSRPIYFIVISLMIIGIDCHLEHVDSQFSSSVTRVAFQWSPKNFSSLNLELILVSVRDLLVLFLLTLPLMFMIGVLPQVNTLVFHLMEQIEMHIFGGTAAFSWLSALVALVRSIVSVAVLSGIGYWVKLMEPKSTQNFYFSAFVAIISSSAYLSSRMSNGLTFWKSLFGDLFSCSRMCTNKQNQGTKEEHIAAYSKAVKEQVVINLAKNEKEEKTEKKNSKLTGDDPLPGLLNETLVLRIQHDIFIFFVNTTLLFALHSTSVFKAAQPYLEIICFFLCVITAICNHHLYPQLRSHTPFKLFARPILKSFEYHQFETTVQANLMFFERVHVWMLILEKYVLYPLTYISFLTTESWVYDSVPLTCLITYRLFRQSYTCPQLLYIPMAVSFVINNSSSYFASDEFQFFAFFNDKLPPKLLLLYILAFLWPKINEFLLKIHFIVVYGAPWQIAWGSAFHAFAQPFSAPHSGFAIAQAMLSSIISAPLNPLLGSTVFIMSYPRPVRFWDKDVNTKRVDHSNLRLISQIERGPMMDDSSLNAIFYEHLTRSLQRSLAGDLAMGRWASTIEPGDCFVLVSMYLSCMVHIIEVGNGFVTFQVRGLEFRGTYCHQREAEAISEDWADGGGCCCCTLGSLPGFLSFNNAFALRFLAWKVTTSKYVIDGYSISDNSAVNLLQVHELRRLLVTLYVKCIIYYTLRCPEVVLWLQNPVILAALKPIINNPRYFDSDTMFCTANDEDFDISMMALSRQKFLDRYASWIKHCYKERHHELPNTDQPDLQIVNCFCFALSVLGRRSLGVAAYNRHANAAESFLYGLHTLFKGDMRIGTPADEWVLADPEILTKVISPAVKMALKLHQDHFAAIDDFDDYEQFYERIKRYQSSIFISHEHDPEWRRAIISNTPSLLALRHMYDESQDDYKVIMLNKMHLNMRVIKINKECVRAFWSGQQQELIFLRNRNPERGSIQNARQVLRNMINSSANQPVGYPIYVSPLITSFVETNSQIAEITGNSITFCSIANQFLKLFRVLRNHFGTSGSSNLVQGSTLHTQGATQSPEARRTAIPTSSKAQDSEVSAKKSFQEDNISYTVSLNTTPGDASPTTQATHRRCQSDVATYMYHKKSSVDMVVPIHSILKDRTVLIKDNTLIQPKLNEPLRANGEFLVKWPSEDMKNKGGQSVWPVGFPTENMTGIVVHEWLPCHPNKDLRSHIGQAICIVEVVHNSDIFYVPVRVDGLEEDHNSE